MKESPEQFQQYQPEEEIHLSDYIDILLRRKKIFIATALTVFIGVVLYTFLMQPVYRASSTVYVKQDNGKQGLNQLNQLLLTGGDNSIQAEIEILKSRTIAEQVVKKLNLDWDIKRSSKGSSCKILEVLAEPAFNELTLTLTGRSEYRLQDSKGKKLGDGESGKPFRHSGMMLNVQVSGKSGDTFTLTRVSLNKAAAALRGATTVKEVGRMTNVIEVSYENSDPRLAKDVVNTMVQSYLDQSLAFKTKEAGKTVSFIEDQLNGIKEELNKAEVNLQDYKSSAGVVQLDTEAQELIRKYSALEQEKVGVNLSKRQIEFALAAQEEALAQGKPYSPAVIKDDPLVAEMARQLAGLEVQKRGLMVDYTANHPAVQNVQAQIDEIQQKIKKTYLSGISNLTKQESDIGLRLGMYEGEMRNIPVEELDLARYTRLAKVTGDIYTFLLQKHEEARISKASTISNINIIDNAEMPMFPVKPEKVKYILIGLMLSLVVGYGATLTLENFDDSIKNEDDAKRILGYAYLSTIPHISQHEGGKQLDEKLAIITHCEQRSIAAEAFRTLRTALHYSATSQKRQVIVVTSSLPNEGKSMISSNLAIAIAQTGAQTILIDCDLYKSTLYKRLGLEKTPGLTDVLTGDIDLPYALQKSGINNLTVLSTGTISPNPSVLLSSIAMRSMVERLKLSYDQIIIDAPPILSVAESIELTLLADQSLIVVEAGRVSSNAAARLSEMLNNVKAPIAGFVFNNKTMRYSSYGYGYEYCQGYSYGHEYEVENNIKRITNAFLKKKK